MREYGKSCCQLIAGGPVSDVSWAIAQLPLIRGGLGLHSSSIHSSAAYFGSLCSSASLCQAIDCNFDTADVSGGSGAADALSWLQSSCSAAAPVQSIVAGSLDTMGSSQKQLSAQLDAAILDTLLHNHSAPGAIPHHLALTGIPGAGAWLTAVGGDDATAIDAPLFRICVQRRLRMPLFEGSEDCCMCGSCVDCFGDHALVCGCGGDRVVRHNSVRGNVFCELFELGMPVEREKAGLLPGRPTMDGLPTASQARRPADVWVPPHSSKFPLALDFAVCSGLRTLNLGEAHHDTSALFTEYEDFKRQYQDTAKQCQAQGIEFVPFVIEAHAGGLSPLARRTLDALIRASPGAAETSSLKMAQRISCSLQRESARAIIRRRRICSVDPAVSGWDVVQDDQA